MTKTNTKIKLISKLTCMFIGHEYSHIYHNLLPTRECKQCGLKQVKLSNKWIKSKYQ